ncbi:MAG: hypothetical protein RQ842_05105 [Vulcanisaeta sp.]|nr:hypothetical protein [Vulcanisaeta sp.]
MNTRYVWASFIMGPLYAQVKRLEDELNKQRGGQGGAVTIGRRVQFYRDDKVDVLSFFTPEEADEVARVLRRAGIPRRLKAFNALVPIGSPARFMRSPFMRALEYLDGKVNIAVSDALINIENQSEVVGFDKVTLDLDIKGECMGVDEAREWAGKVVKPLKSLTGVEPIVVWSGCKGIHIIYFLNNILGIEYLAPLRAALLKYSGLEGLGLKLDLRTQEPKHVFKLPLTTHLKSGARTEFLHFRGFKSHVLSTEVVKALALMYDPLLGRRIAVPTQQPSKPLLFADKVTQWSSFIEWLKNNNIKLPDCRKRFAYLLGAYCRQAGMGEDACEELLTELIEDPRIEHFRLMQHGYDKPEYLPSVYKFVKGGEWYSCTELEELRKFRIPRVKAPTPQPQAEQEPKPSADTTAVNPVPKPEPNPETQSADPKPKEKPEGKPEAKPAETKPSGRPVQTRLTRFVERPRGEEKAEAKPSEEVKQAEKLRDEHLVVIDIPTALVEDVARELRAPTTIAETLVNWVVGYLNRPCCWSVGFERLAIDLSRASDEETQFALETLGIEVKERRITDDGFAKLRSALLTIIKYLEKAGFVQYVREDYTVNFNKGGQS